MVHLHFGHLFYLGATRKVIHVGIKCHYFEANLRKFMFWQKKIKIL